MIAWLSKKQRKVGVSENNKDVDCIDADEKLNPLKGNESDFNEDVILRTFGLKRFMGKISL